MYEDSNYCGNRFLMAMVWRQLALGPGDTAGRTAVTRAYLASILSAQRGAALEPGYWPKPYGGLRGPNAVGVGYTETSVDQAYSPVIALHTYCRAGLATPEQQVEITHRLIDHGHWWIRHEYRYDFLGKVWSVFGANPGEMRGEARGARRFGKISSPSSALKIPVGLHRAHGMAAGGDEQLLRDALDIIAQASQDGAFAMHRGPRGETKELYHWARMYSYCQDHLDLSSLQDWPTLIGECWRAAVTTILPSGLCIGQGEFLADGTIAKYEPGPIDDVHHNYWCTDAPHPPSTAQMACLAMLMHSRGEVGAAEIGRALLSALTPVTVSDIDGYIYDREEQMPPVVRETRMEPRFNTRTVVFWLEAYWLGRLHRAIGADH
jgi:hypothetical protein